MRCPLRTHPWHHTPPDLPLHPQRCRCTRRPAQTARTASSTSLHMQAHVVWQATCLCCSPSAIPSDRHILRSLDTMEGVVNSMPLSHAPAKSVHHNCHCHVVHQSHLTDTAPQTLRTHCGGRGELDAVEVACACQRVGARVGEHQPVAVAQLRQVVVLRAMCVQHTSLSLCMLKCTETCAAAGTCSAAAYHVSGHVSAAVHASRVMRKVLPANARQLCSPRKNDCTDTFL